MRIFFIDKAEIVIPISVQVQDSYCRISLECHESGHGNFISFKADVKFIDLFF